MIKLKILLIFFILLSIAGHCTTEHEVATYRLSSSDSTPNDYYGVEQDLSGEDLRNRLYLKIKDHHKFTYRQVWDALKYTDEDPENRNHVILIYSGKSIDKDKNNSVERNHPDYWNREHIWPKSHGFPKMSQAAYTDLHHLRPADRTINSSRGHKDFDFGGKQHREAPDTKSDKDSWEPRPAVRGDIARMLFYMDVKYSELEGYDLELVNDTDSDSGDRTLGKLCTLLIWNQNDPVDQFEMQRHERIFKLQKNRNPFIDHPEWADRIWGDRCR